MKDSINNSTLAPSSDDTTLEVKFTQADIDKAVAESVLALQSKYPSDDEIAEFENLKQSSAQLNEMLSDYAARAENAETKLKALALGASFDSVDDIINLAHSYTSDEIPLDNAISLVMQKYPHFSNADNRHPVSQVNTAIPFAPSLNSSLNGVEQAFISRNPWVKL